MTHCECRPTLSYADIAAGPEKPACCLPMLCTTLSLRWIAVNPAVGYACCAATFTNVSVVDTHDRPFLFVDTPGMCGPGWGMQ